jgi:phosphate transport system permease protein
VNVIALTLSLAAMAFGVFWLIWILFETVRLGWGGLNAGGVHRDDAAAAGRHRRPGQRHLRLADDGGLATLLGTPIGILAGGIYLAEYGQKGLAGPACASSTTSCCRRRRSSSACSSTRWWWRRLKSFSAWPACWRWR